MRNKKISTITKFLKNEILDQEFSRFTFEKKLVNLKNKILKKIK